MNTIINSKYFFRDPNLIYKVDKIVGIVTDCTLNKTQINIKGHIDNNLNTEKRELHFDQILILDKSWRFIKARYFDNNIFSIDISKDDIGNDNNYLILQVVASNSKENFAYPLHVPDDVYLNYKKFVKKFLPENSVDVPSIRGELKLILNKAIKYIYIAKSIKDGISTGNRYQTIIVDGKIEKGGRDQLREKLMQKIDFTGKHILDLGANTGEISRYVRRHGAALVDGYEFDPFFVETGHLINAIEGITRVSLFQGDITNYKLFNEKRYDIILALNVWVYICKTIKQLSKCTDIIVFETHTLGHGIEFYYQQIIPYFPCAVSLGYSQFNKDPHNSRMLILFGKSMSNINSIYKQEFIQIKPYFPNPFIAKNRSLTKEQVFALSRKYYKKYKNKSDYSDSEYRFESPTYFEVFLGGFFQFLPNAGKPKNIVDETNIYFSYMTKAINSGFLDQSLKSLVDNPSWMIRKISNKYEDAFNIVNGHENRVPPIYLSLDPNGKFTFTTTTGEILRASNIDGHHRHFMCELCGIEKIHFYS